MVQLTHSRLLTALAAFMLVAVPIIAAGNGATTIALDLSEGSHIVGLTDVASFTARTSYGSMDIALCRIVSISISNDHQTAMFHLLNGDRVRGTLDGKPIAVKTGFGTVSAPVEHLRAVQVYRGPAPPAGFRKELLLHLTFDKEQGLTIPDNSGNANDAEAVRGKWTAEGKAGGGYLLDGKNDYITVPRESAFDFGPSDFTIALWVKLDKLPADRKQTQTLVSKYEGMNGCQWRLELTDKGMLSMVTSTRPERGWDQSRTSRNNTMKEGRWHHVAVRAFEREAVFHVDGRPLSEEGTSAAELGGGNEPVRIGAYKGNDGKLAGFLGGTVDDVMIWKRALSEAEIGWLAGNREPWPHPTGTTRSSLQRHDEAPVREEI